MDTSEGPSGGEGTAGRPSQAPPPPGRLVFLGELQRRRVFRALAFYGAAAFAILQVVEPVQHGLQLPDWVLSAVVLILGAGFPVAAGLAWAFDLQATGLVRTPPADGSAGVGAGSLRGGRLAAVLLGLGLTVAAPGVAYHFVWRAGSGRARDAPPPSPLAEATYRPLTDFDGTEEAAAISRDGRFVAFLSDRAGHPDVWITQVGTGQFVNLTGGAAPDIVNPSLRTLGFSPDGTQVAFWARQPGGSKGTGISVWAAPLLGGRARPYLEGVAEFDWSGDGRRLVFHTPGPGDPMFVADDGRPEVARQVFVAPAGQHGHFLLWSPDQRWIYFVQGLPPDRMDLWRIRPTGGDPERLTHHDAAVTYPVWLGPGTLLYLATDQDGMGPYVYALELERGTSRRVSAGIDCFTSLSASADGRRLVATLASPKVTLWRAPLEQGRATLASARRVALTTANGSAPRLGPGFLAYVASRGAGDGLWRLQGAEATELWSAPQARIVGGAAIRRGDGRLAFVARRGERTELWEVGADGSGARVLDRTLELRGAPAWSPDGQAVAVTAIVDGAPRLLAIPAGGGPPRPLTQGQGQDPAWSPDGDLLVFSGANVGTTFPVRAVRVGGEEAPLPPLRLSRGARHVAFLAPGRVLLVLRGDLRHKELVRIDLDDGQERTVIDLPADFDVRDFDVSPDGKELVLEQVQSHADIVLLDMPRRAP